MKKIAIFPGSFDPFTNGHADIVARAGPLFDSIVIAIGYNSTKKRYFEIDEMKSKLEKMYASNSKIKIVTYSELTTSLAQKLEAKYLLRGLRNTIDFEYEDSIAQVNKSLDTNLETVFLITSPQNKFISSSIVREIHKFGGDISKYIPFSL